MRQYVMNPSFTLRSLRGILFSLPAAFMFTFNVGAFLVVQDWESEWQISLTGFLVGWAAVGVWIAESNSRTRTLSRACRALAVASFLLPVALIAGLIHTPDPQNMILSPYIFMIFYVLFGTPMGFVSWRMAQSFARKDQDQI